MGDSLHALFECLLKPNFDRGKFAKLLGACPELPAQRDHASLLRVGACTRNYEAMSMLDARNFEIHYPFDFSQEELHMIVQFGIRINAVFNDSQRMLIQWCFKEHVKKVPMVVEMGGNIYLSTRGCISADLLCRNKIFTLTDGHEHIGIYLKIMVMFHDLRFVAKVTIGYDHVCEDVGRMIAEMLTT